MTLARVAVASFALAVLALACSNWSETLRSGTYPPSFEYISKKQLDSVMWQMARDTRDLERLFAQPGPRSEPERQRARALLAAVYDESGRLGAEARARITRCSIRTATDSERTSRRRGAASSPSR